MSNQTPSPKPTDAEQESGKGLDETTCSPIFILGEIELCRTIQGDEYKYWINGEKGYLNAADCKELAATMIRCALILENETSPSVDATE